MNLDEVIIWAKKNITEKEFKWIILGIDLRCRQCTRCCIIPAIPKLNKPANKICEYLTESGLCSVHDDYSKRPRGCDQWPVLDSFWFMITKPSGQIRWQYNICPIIKKFWGRIYKFMESQDGNNSTD